MAKKKRHSKTEIARKLDKADALAVAGQTQSDIAKALGITVMTLHRWRKATPQQRHRLVAPDQMEPDHRLSAAERGTGIAQLQLENARLRKLVTDLLLEKMRLEDLQELRSPSTRSERAPRASAL